MKNSCSGNGHVVGAKQSLPMDPCDYDVGWNIGTVGCNNLYCRRCDIPVRNAVGLDLKECLELSKLLKQLHNLELSTGELDIYGSAYMKYIYDLPDMGASPLVRSGALGRLYVCRCSSWSEVSFRSLDTSDPIPSDPNVPWSCAAHPVVTLPHEFDGVRAESAADLIEMCQRSLRGFTPPGALPSDRNGADWATRLHGRLAGTLWQETVDAAAAELLDDPDPLICARAIQLFDRLQAPVGMERGVELLQTKRSQFVGIPDKISDYPESRTLEDSLLAMILPLARTPGRAQDFVRAEVLTPGKGQSYLYRFLAYCDPEWLAANAEQILRATPEQGPQLFDSFRRSPETFDAQPVRQRLKALLPKPAPKQR